MPHALLLKRVGGSLGIILLLSSLVLIVWSAWPAPIEHQTLAFSDKFLAQVGFTPAQQDALMAYHLARMTVAWPSSLRIGEKGSISLLVEPVSGSLSPGSLAQNLVSEAWLDLLSVELMPSSLVRTPLPPGKPLRFAWQVVAAQNGVYTGTAWFYIVFLPGPGTQDSQEEIIPISAQDFSLRAVSLAGLDVAQARDLGAAGFTLGALIILIVVIKS